MSTVIFTHAISGKSGIDKSVIYTANVLSQNDVDVYIYTLADHNYGPNIFAHDIAFKLDKRVKSYPLLRYNIANKNKIELANRVEYNISHEFLKMNVTSYHYEAMKEICNSLTENDTIIFANPIASEIYERSNASTKAYKIVQIHSDYEQDKENMNHLKKSYQNIDFIQTVSKGMNPYLKKKFNLKDNEIGTIYNVISMSEEINKISKVKSDHIRISIIGSFQERKNQLDAIKMIELLDDNYKLHIYGAPNNEYYEEVLEYIERNQIQNKVIIEGFKAEEEIYSNSDIVVVTSISEGFGYTLAESIKNGIPIVSYDYKYGANEIVEDGFNGYLIEPGNYHEMADKIKLLMQNKQYENFRDNCIDSYRRKFSNELIFNEYKKFIKPNVINTNIHKFLNEEEEIQFKVNIIDNDLYKWRRSEIEIICEKEFIENNNIKALYIMHLNKKIELPFKIKGNKVIAELKGIGVHIIYTMYFVLDEETECYICNRSYRGNVEKLNRNSMSNNSKISIYDKYLNSFYISDSLSERVVSITDTNNNEKEFSYIEKALYNGVYQRLIKIYNIQTNAKIHLQSGRILEISKTKTKTKTYDDIWNDLLEIEEKYDLFNRKINDVHYWELIKSPLIIDLMKNNMFWKATPVNIKKYDIPINYKKVLYTCKQNIPESSKTLICNVGTNYNLYDNIIDNNTIIHTNCIESYLHYYQKYENNAALHEGNIEKIDILSKEELKNIHDESLKLSEYLQCDYELIKLSIKSRYSKFKYTYNFYYNFLKDSNIKEVIVVSSIWDQGIVAAAKKLNIKTSELQYAFISDNHLNYGITSKRNYAPDNIYIWNDYWENKSDFSQNQTILEEKKEYDFAIVSQHLLTEYTIKIVKKLINKYPDKKVAILSHPSEVIDEEFDNENVDIIYGNTIKIAMQSKIVFGYYSTALFQMLKHDQIMIVKTPGWEMTRQEKKFKVIELDEIGKEV